VPLDEDNMRIPVICMNAAPYRSARPQISPDWGHADRFAAATSVGVERARPGRANQSRDTFRAEMTANTEPMTPLDIVRAFVDAVERKDLDAAMTLVHPDCEYDNVPMGKNIGTAAIRALLERFLGSASTVEWVVHREAAMGSVVFNERTDRFEMAHGWVDLPVTGVWEVHGGLITLWRDYFDAQMYMSQIPGR
jgi:limonene-1,2-epoxide hydrolase